jgi:Trk K+ transport system NAD-binding subunit
VPAPWNGRPLSALTDGVACTAVSVTRGGRASLAAPDMRLETGDLVHVAAPLEGLDELRRRFDGREA